MKTVTKFARIVFPLACAALIGLAGCSKGPQHDGADEPSNYSEEQNSADMPPEAAPPAPAILNEAPPANVAIAAPADPVAEDQQVQEDADASGMTSRLPNEEQPGTPAVSENAK